MACSRVAARSIDCTVPGTARHPRPSAYDDVERSTSTAQEHPPTVVEEQSPPEESACP
jgi:hypothetical protein